MVDYPIFWGGIHKHFTRVHYLGWHLSRITDMLAENIPAQTNTAPVTATAWQCQGNRVEPLHSQQGNRNSLRRN